MKALLWVLTVVLAFCAGLVFEDEIDGDLTRIDTAYCGEYVGTLVLFRGESEFFRVPPEDGVYDRTGTLHMCHIRPDESRI